MDKVFIGILDPNQGVTGKGLWALQAANIEVELFPPDLAKEILSINEAFISEQQTLGLSITSPQNGSTIRTWDKGGVCTFEGTYLNPPGDSVYAFTKIGATWWPQPNPVVTTHPNKWSVKVHFGDHVPHTVAIVRANDLGKTLINTYLELSRTRQRARKEIQSALEPKLKELEAHGIQMWKVINMVGNQFPGIAMSKLPKGLQLQTQIDVIVEDPNKKDSHPEG